MKTIALIICALSIILTYAYYNDYHQQGQQVQNYQAIQARQEAQIQRQQGTQLMMQQIMQNEEMRRTKS
jgi:hypothetical protein